MAPSGEAYNVDWVVSNNSNVHVATNRDWFTSFTPFKTHYGHAYLDSRTEVLGVGTVELHPKLHRQRRPGRPNSSCITLQTCLYAPSAPCNVFGMPDPSKFILQPDSATRNEYILMHKDGGRVGLVEMPNLPRLRLHGQAAGKSSLNSNAIYFINAYWSDVERAKWILHQAGIHSVDVVSKNDGTALPDIKPQQARFHNNCLEGSISRSTSSEEGKERVPPYSQDEKKWLKTNYGNEFKFLRDHGMSIYKEDDREVGRTFARRLIKEDDSSSENSGLGRDNRGRGGNGFEDDDDDDADDFLREMEEDPMSHLADYNFSQVELKWIKKHYQHSANFMLSYGLKPFSNEDCDEAKAIIQAVMED